MKRTRFTRRSKQTPHVERLVRLATCLAQAGGALERAFWENRLCILANKLLADDDEAAVNGALDQLYGVGGAAYDELADCIEAACENRRIESATASAKNQDVQLIALPVLAWSRAGIFAGPISEEILQPIRVQLQAHVLAQDTRLALIAHLYSPDQMPHSYPETWALTEKLTPNALHNRDIRIDAAQLPETMPFLSDCRYIVGAVTVARGQPLFRWQEDDGVRSEALKQWRLQGGETVRPLLPACAMELQLPHAFHAAVREADRASRPYSLRAAVAYLQTTFNLPAANGLRALIAPFYDRQIEEYRISFMLGSGLDVVHGVVWPLLDFEDEAPEATAQIETVLKESGVQSVAMFDERFPLEYCDDCGAPLYINPDGEPVHAELPDEMVETAPMHLH